MKKTGFIAIIGRPNSGKSTLLNHILGSEISIVSPKAQTTREQVLGILSEPEHGQIVFVDTPGIHQAKEGGINAYMMSEAKEALVDPSCVWYLLDPSYALPSDLKHEEIVFKLLHEAGKPVFILLNKTDLGARASADPTSLERLEKRVREEAEKNGVPLEGVFRISARNGKGVKDLLAQSWNLLPEGPAYFPDEEQLSDRPMRFFVAEKVREQLFFCLGDELPYSCAVKIEEFDESSEPPRIQASIFVERDSQKGMVIGKGGQKIKEIGQGARAKIEQLMGCKIFLGLKVEVLKNWTRDAEAMKRLGYVFRDPRKGSRREK